MRLVQFRSFRTASAIAFAGAMLIAAALTPASAQAYYGGRGHGGYGYGPGYGFGVGLGLGFGYAGGWPGYYYPYGRYAYDYYPPVAPVSTVVVQAPAAAPALAAPSYYYCTNPQGYYPYVASCATPWQQVPLTPPAGR